MPLIPVLVILFGVAGAAASLYLRFTVKSPILQTAGGEEEHAQGLSIQQILNLIFVYFTVLHIIIALIGVQFLLAE